MDNESSLFLTLKRYAEVSGTLVGLASRVLADKKTSYTLDNDAYAETLKSALGHMKGPFMKIAQFLATIPDALPSEYATAFQDLQCFAPPMGGFFVRRRMQTELGEGWRHHFDAFNENPHFAASLGQVHYALYQGKPLALKLQYPNMDAIVDADLKQAALAIKAYHIFNQALDLDAVLIEIRDRLYEELDYNQEAHHAQLYQSFFQDRSDVRIPLIEDTLSTKRLLAMEWIDGVSILTWAETASQDERNAMGKVLFKAWYRPFYLRGMIHGDPHPGNYKVDSDGRLCILDFGCIRVFGDDFVDAVIDLYEGLKSHDNDRIKMAYQRWGFGEVSDVLMDIMTKWARLLYDPLLDDRIRPIQEPTEKGNLKGWQVATEVHRQLDAAGGVKVPREFVFMDRAAVGIGSVLMRLGCSLNWHELFEEILKERNGQT